jgi:hypothetical protein
MESEQVVKTLIMAVAEKSDKPRHPESNPTNNQKY